MDLSIIIPVYNEQHKISHDIQAVAEFLQSQNLSGEIIIVDDGSTDQTAEQARNAAVSEDITCTVHHFELNQGKGHAIRHGVLQSQGQIVLFMDSGQCVPLSAANEAIQDILARRCHIAIGSRRLPTSQNTQDQSPYRMLCSYVFRIFLRLLLPQLNPYSDTQCGFKLYHGPAARELFAASVINGFMFDIEILTLALKRDLTLKEFPITWTCDRDSRLGPGRSLIPVLKDLWKIRSQG